MSGVENHFANGSFSGIEVTRSIALSFMGMRQ